uniref:complement decay-accelerating factor transmembrane isoform-like isoform X1 n=1 Tax=Doryrhamphus excisus TaxID=161450 RepID=UPI0025AEC7AD|nr:complement decay-accelerating factor transmembrane isoform-like isoform X1 [Doryrhamphus excisus]XP_057906608.1 complement decay-accelerating factor transmembrane isoform-like isoform X1 [Doryrhamphus excisus]
MKNLRIIVFLAISLLASAQIPRRCSSPPKYPTTRLRSRFSRRHTFDSGQKVYYNCVEDFVPHAGNLSVTCIDGTWTKLTLKCEKKSCGNAGDLPHGWLQYEGHSFIGEKVYAICNDGYTLKGPKYMTCKKSGWTGKFPTCEEDTTCSTPEVPNSVGSNVSFHHVGEKMTFTCTSGFMLDGPQQITCGPSGQWEPKPPRCLTSLSQGGCGTPANIKNSNTNLADRFITRTTFAPGEQVHYTCDVGYRPVGGSRYRTCVRGQWTPLLLKCERKLCGSAGEIKNGYFIYSGVEFGDTATAHCDEGFQLVGRSTRNCMSFGWDGRAPFCEVVECEEPPEVTNAMKKGPVEGPYKYRSVIVYECRRGTLLGNKEVWCTKNGTWSTPPTCREITCPPPSVPNAAWTRAHTRPYQHRDAVTIDCRHGYTRVGVSTVTCGNNGQWIPSLPKCRHT